MKKRYIGVDMAINDRKLELKGLDMVAKGTHRHQAEMVAHMGTAHKQGWHVEHVIVQMVSTNVDGGRERILVLPSGQREYL